MKNIFVFRDCYYLLILVSLLAVSVNGMAGPRDQAKRIHDRLAAAPPSEAVLASMAAKIDAGDSIGAAMEAMNNPGFYNIFLKNWITPWTNISETVFAPLNDYTATAIGVIRDDISFQEILTADVVYIGVVAGLPSYSHTNNDHYQSLEDSNANLGSPAVLQRVQQSTLPNAQLSSSQTAGVLTTRAAGEAFLSAGTNRRMIEFAFKNHLCSEMAELNDVSRPPDRIRQDVSRSPGGDSAIFLNSCVGCHAGMDPLTQAFAYYEWDAEAERVVFTNNSVQDKYLINANTFPLGYVTANDQWINYWRKGKNALLEWRGTSASGFGVKSLGEELVSSRAFSTCQVKKAFKEICFRAPANPMERNEINRIADVFESSNYSMKRVFAEVASYCMGS
ncbi:MAG: hypothetical protein OEZ68_02845 [Gammaproteobacteria bacterium]|nr:hypothetical protein [Gammaproteobacteria bacterium]MDH5799719.1 hypothetical protein [Gammaproteobacteria bacterium]